MQSRNKCYFWKKKSAGGHPHCHPPGADLPSILLSLKYAIQTERLGFRALWWKLHHTTAVTNWPEDTALAPHPQHTAASPHSGRSQHEASQVPHARGTEGRSTQDTGPPRDVSAREAASLTFMFQVPAPRTSPGKCQRGWIAGRTDGRMDERMNRQKERRMDSGRTDGREDGRMDRREGAGCMKDGWAGEEKVDSGQWTVDGWMEVSVDGRVHGCVCGRAGVCAGTWTGGGRNGWVHGWTV